MALGQRELNELLRKCLKYFTDQHIDVMLPLGQDMIVQDKDGRITIAKDHAFFKNYPSARLAMISLLKAFCESYATSAGNNAYFKQKVCSEMNLGLSRALYTYAQGIDLEFLIALGGERYESSASDGLTLLLCPKGMDLSALKEKGVTLFAENVHQRLASNKVHAIRKQLNMARRQRGNLLVAYLEPEDGEAGFYTVGLGTIELEKTFPHIYFEDHASWRFVLPDAKEPKKCNQIRYKGGQFLLPYLDLSNAEGDIIHRWLDNAAAELTAQRALKLAREQRKGTVVILGSKAVMERETTRLCGKRMCRGISFVPPATLFDCDVPEPEQLRHLTAIDGALLVDFDGNCHACGVILDGEATTEGDMSRGARYNSTRNYLHILQEKEKNSPILAIIASEDGIVDLLWGEDV